MSSSIKYRILSLQNKQQQPTKAVKLEATLESQVLIAAMCGAHYCHGYIRRVNQNGLGPRALLNSRYATLSLQSLIHADWQIHS